MARLPFQAALAFRLGSGARFARRARDRAFTLIELMVVIGVILLLIVVIAASFGGAFGRSDRARAQATIEVLKSNIQSFETRWGQPPPSTLQGLAELTRALNLNDPNATNQGIETLVLALRSGREGGPYLAPEVFNDNARIGNLDNDTFSATAMTPAGLDLPDDAANDLFEILDPWGNPFIYVNMAELRAGRAKDSIQVANGEITELDMFKVRELLQNPKTKDYPQGFALWSTGANGINEFGRGDDITSWPKYEDDE